MQASHGTPGAEVPPPDGEPRAESPVRVEPPKAGPRSLSSSRLWCLALLTALVVGPASWFAGETTYKRFRATDADLPREVTRSQGRYAAAMLTRTEASTRARAAAAYAILGG